MKIVGFQSKLPNTLMDSEGQKCTFTTIREVLDFLLEPHMLGGTNKTPALRQTYRVAWDMDATIAPMLRLLPTELAKQLHKTAHCRLSFPAKEGSEVLDLWYARHKGFSVKNLSDNSEATLYHLAQFFPPEVPEPETMVDLEAYTRTLFKAYQDIGFFPQNLYSPISVLATYLAHMDVPTYKDIPLEVSEFCIPCGAKVWSEAHQIGFWKKAYDYDLTGAFPGVLSKCPDVRFGNWIRSKEPIPQAHYGFCKVKVTITSQISPIIYKPEGREGDLSPVGTWSDYLTMREIDTVRKWGLGSVDILDGWWWIPRDQKIRRPLGNLIERLQRARQRGDRLISWNTKAMMVGLYGYTGYEKKNELGPYNNPALFAMATSETRCNLADFIFSHKILEPILIATDGVLSPKKVKLTYEDEQNGWKLSHAGEALVISTGVSYLGNKKPLGLDLQKIKALIETKPTASYWQVTKKRVLTLGEACEWNALDRLGELRDFRISVDLNTIDRDRKFRRYPKTGAELLTKHFTSKAIRVKG